jgi:hypothetical protein
MPSEYPDWFFYPSRMAPPQWVAPLIGVISAAREHIDSAKVTGLSSDAALEHLRSGLEGLGFRVESDKRASGKIRRPVLFGEKGAPLVSYEIDGWHESEKIAFEIEAGRGLKGNALYRDLIRTPLIFDAEFLAIGLLREYHYNSGGKSQVGHDYRDAKNQLDAIYASGRLQFPFKGILLFGY